MLDEAPLEPVQQDLVRLVQAKMGEVLYTGDPAEMHPRVVYQELTYAMQDVLLAVPKSLLPTTAVQLTPHQADPMQIATPVGFLRFVRVQVEGWVRAVHQLQAPDAEDSRYHFETLPFTQSCIHAPAAYWLGEGNSTLGAIECYPAGPRATLVYIRRYTPVEGAALLEGRLLDALICNAAKRVLLLDEEMQAATAMHDQYVSALQNLTTIP